MTPALRLEEVVVEYAPVRALDGLTLAVERGEWVAILGPNGAGKSTLLRVATGVVRPRSGAVFLGERSVARMTPREIARTAAVVPQEVWMPFPYTALEIVLMGRAPHLGWLGLEGEADYARGLAALARTDAAHLADRPLDTLSGGERQRVLLARAIAQEAPLLLLDEPTTHLDIAHQIHFLDLLRELHREGRTIVTILHDLNLAALYAPRLVLLAGGRLLADGSANEVLTESRLAQAFGARVCLARHPAVGCPVVLPLPGDRATAEA